MPPHDGISDCEQSSLNEQEAEGGFLHTPQAEYWNTIAISSLFYNIHFCLAANCHYLFFFSFILNVSLT